MHTGIPRPRTASFSLHISTTGSGGSTVSSSITPSTNSPTNLGRVPVDARVVLSRRRSGYVRYVGKLKSEAGEWYGVALDEAKGEHDGRWLGERHFACAPNHGVFVRRKEIFYVKEQQSSYTKSPPSPVMNDSSEDVSSGTSTSSSSASVASHDATEAPLLQVGAVADPGHAVASPTLSPLQRTFKSFRRALQSPSKLGESLTITTSASALPSAQSPQSPRALSPSKTIKEPTTPTRRTASSSRGSMIPPPAIASPKNQSASRQQSLAFHAINHDHNEGPAQRGATLTALVLPAAREEEEKQRTEISQSIFEEDNCFASMTRTLAEVEQEQNNLLSSLSCPAPAVVRAPVCSATIPEVPPLPPQIDTQELSRYETISSSSPPSASASSSSPSPQRRLSIDRRHSTFAFGSPTVSAGTATAAANATRVVELEKEIVAMRTNHENVVAVLRATNKQHAANVLELRVQVSALADGTGWLQKQLSSKSSQLLELKQSERLAATQRTEIQAQLHARDHKIHALEQEITVLQSKTEAMHREKDSVLLEMRKEFQARQQRDREQIQRLRGEVLSLVNARSSLQSELRDAKEMSFLF